MTRSARRIAAHRHRIVAAALGLWLVAGCGTRDTDDAANSDAGQLTIALATYDPTGTGGDSAQLAGELIDLDGCLVVRQADGTVLVPIWPDARIVGDQLELLGRSYSLGDMIDVGGGGTTSESMAWAIPEVCRALDLPMWIVSQG